MQKLTRQEQAVLSILQLNEGEVVSKRQLLEEAWGGNYLTPGTVTRTVDVIIYRLRKKFGSRRIHTVCGRGYRLTVATSAEEVSSAHA